MKPVNLTLSNPEENLSANCPINIEFDKTNNKCTFKSESFSAIRDLI